MISSEFVTSLSEVMRVQHTELATVDRALAKQGLRQIARGRFRPDITLQEGLQIILAWAGTESLTLAAEELERLKTFGLVANEPTISEDDEFASIFGAKHNELEGEGFFELLLRASRNLGHEAYPSNDVWVTVQKNSGVDISYRSGSRRITLRFSRFAKFEFRKPGEVTNVVVSVRISGRVLKWLFDVTEGA